MLKAWALLKIVTGFDTNRTTMTASKLETKPA